MLKRLPGAARLQEANRLHKEINRGNNSARLIDQTVEECAELQAALMQYRRGRVPLGSLIEEMSDVIICVDAILDELAEEAAFEEIFSAKVNKYLAQMGQAKCVSHLFCTKCRTNFHAVEGKKALAAASGRAGYIPKFCYKCKPKKKARRR